MAVTWLDPGGSATGGTELLSSVTQGTAQTTVKNGQAYAYQITTSSPAANAAAQRNAILAAAGRRISMYVRFPAAPTGDTNVGLLSVQPTGSGTSLLRVALDSARKLRLYTNGTTTQVGATGATVLAVDTWYRISLSYAITTTTNWGAKVYIDGVQEMARTNADATLSSAVPADLAVRLGSGAGTNWLLYASDIYVDDTSDQSDPGNIHVTAKLPTTTTTGNFDGTVGTGAVNERPVSTSNGKSHANTTDVDQDYEIEAASAGDADLTGATVVGSMGWIWATLGSLTGTPSTNVIFNGARETGTWDPATANVAQLFLSTILTSSTYPQHANGKNIGSSSSVIAADTFLYDCGVVVAYIPSASSNANVTPGMVTLATAATAATEVVKVSPATVALTATATAATTVVSTSPAMAPLAVAVMTPTVTTVANVTVTPGMVTLAATATATSPGVTVSPSMATLAASLPAAAESVTVTPAEAALSITASAVSVSAGGAVNITPPMLVLTPSVSATTTTGAARVTPSSVSITASTLAASEAITASPSMLSLAATLPASAERVTVTPAAAALAVALTTPTITAATHYAVVSWVEVEIPNAGAWLTPAQLGPQVSLSSASPGVAHAPAMRSLTLTPAAATVTGTARVTPPMLALAVSTQAAQTVVAVSPSMRSLTLATSTATETAGATVAPAKVNATLTLQQATASAGGNVNISPAKVALALSTQTATASAGASVAPSMRTLALSTQAPTVSVGATVTPPMLTLSVAATASTAGAGPTITPSMVALAVAANTVSLATSVSVAPPALAVAIGLSAATIGTGTSTQVGMLSLTVSVLSAGVFVGEPPTRAVGLDQAYGIAAAADAAYSAAGATDAVLVGAAGYDSEV